METNDHIAFYCFNRTCKSSVYFSNTVKVTDLPMTIETLAIEHRCSVCHSRLVSILDIELKTALNRKANQVKQNNRLVNKV